MLQIKHIRKEYRTGSLVQKALDDVSFNLRDNEFVAVLGPSGSGKTTLLNIIGGLDRYDSGDLIINGISTKKYKDRDWDSYRNHTIGFVFQSYNLIPHQNILSNVELALTISGIGKRERRERAKKALEEVGLGNQLHKKPNQLSGGQMQRVAIARALVNDPDILLADEPTGALDSDTSVQVMDLLREVAKDRLVVMVTHNPELAEKYATRIINLRDGKIVSDSNPYDVDESVMAPPTHRNMGKSSMSLLTALTLSFNNLWTKKARTLLTAFAGSIGIIGIALILSLSNGVNEYIQSVEEDTLSEYPLQITSAGFDMTSLLASGVTGSSSSGEEGDVQVIQMVTSMFSTLNSNDLEALKEYLESGESGIEPYAKAIEYIYDVTPQIFLEEEDGVRQVNPDSSFSALGFGSSASSSSLLSSMMSTDVFYELPGSSSLYEGQYEVKAGRWPENYNECVVVLSSGGAVSDFMLYALGLRDSVELSEMVSQFVSGENVDTPTISDTYDYEDFVGITFKLVNSCDYYEYDSEYGVWTDKSGNTEYMEALVAAGEDLVVVGVVEPAAGASVTSLETGIAYTTELTDYVVEQAANSEIVKQQLADPSVNVFTGEPFGEESEESSFSMGSLLSVDADALESLFSLDEDTLSEAFDMDSLSDSLSLDGSSLDLSSLDLSSLDLSEMMDLSSLSLDASSLPEMDLGSALSGIDLSISSDGLSSLVESLLEGYLLYAESNPEADYTTLADNFSDYLSTEEAMEILTENIQEMILSGGQITVDVDAAQEMMQALMTDYLSWLLEQDDESEEEEEETGDVSGSDAGSGSTGGTDIGDLTETLTEALLSAESLNEYLQTSRAQEILSEWASQIFALDGNLSISSEQVTALVSDLWEGYQTYAEENSLPNPANIEESLTTYLNSADGQQRIMNGITQMINLDSIETGISNALLAYMEQVMALYGEALAEELSDVMEEAMEQIMEEVMEEIAGQLEEALTEMMSEMSESLVEAMEDAFQIDTDSLSEIFSFSLDEESLTELLLSLNSSENATYESNLTDLGYADFASPSEIDIYPLNFDAKEEIVQILDDYNARMEEEGLTDRVITYTDLVGTLMSSVTDIIDIISYVLIAFVAISLVVSSIMIGVITYISVLERRKEIGILRAIGASKANISQVFNAETFIIGLCAGVIGIGLSLLLLIPGNALIHNLAGTDDVSAILPAGPAIFLIFLSVVLTLIGGLIPSRKAAKSDPVTALRTD